jgi:sulfite exporter TauE/SafE
MFTILGIIIAIFGFTTEGSSIYGRSLGININIWSGCFMLVFGLLMLYFSELRKKKTK